MSLFTLGDPGPDGTDGHRASFLTSPEKSQCELRSKEEFRVVFAGATETLNGVEVMLHAIPLLKSNHDSFVFACVGPLVPAPRRRRERFQNQF